MRESGTLLERIRSIFTKRPFDVWRGVQQWTETPHAPLVWAWFADFCGVYETADTSDPVELARAEGRREAFFALYDLSTMRRDDLLELQKRAEQIGGNYT